MARRWRDLLEEARRIAAEHGLPVPEIGEYEGERNAEGRGTAGATAAMPMAACTKTSTRRGLQEGRGTISDASGAVFEAEYSPEGRHVRLADGSSEPSSYKAGDFRGRRGGAPTARRRAAARWRVVLKISRRRRVVSRRSTVPSPLPEFGEYEGDHNAEGRGSGRGTCRFADGGVYEGERASRGHAGWDAARIAPPTAGVSRREGRKGGRRDGHARRAPRTMRKRPGDELGCSRRMWGGRDGARRLRATARGGGRVAAGGAAAAWSTCRFPTRTAAERWQESSYIGSRNARARSRRSLACQSDTLPVHKGMPLMALDDKLAEAGLASSAIKLIRADFMKQSTQPHLLRRQDLEALERDEQIAEKPDEAVALLRSNNRAIAALTYGWVTPDHPDETDEYLANMRRFLNHPLGAHIGGCLGISLAPQRPRTDAEKTRRSLTRRSVEMGDVCRVGDARHGDGRAPQDDPKRRI